MHVKLIAPRLGLRPMDSEYKRVLSPSLALLVLAALTPPEHRVEIADENTATLTTDDHPDLVGVTVNVNTAPRAYAIAESYRRRHIPVILGGIHPSANPEEALQYADAVCVGEAEGVWATILADTAAGRLRGRYQAPGPVDPALIPFPKWEAIDTSRYLYTNIICASRGCAFRCDFCYNSGAHVPRGARVRPLPQVLAEIARLGTRHVMFIDDNFISNPAWTREFVQAVKPLRLRWNAAVSANIGNHPDLLDEMKESGCQSLFIGFETINEAALRRVHKQQNRVGRYERLIGALHDRGIMINASLVFGFDDDGPAVFDDTLAWLIAHRLETMTAHILTPYPGTVLYQRLLAEHRIRDFDWSHYDTAHVVFTPRSLTPEQLRDGYLRVYRRFYSLANIWRRLPAAREQWLPYLCFNFGYRKLGWLTSKVAAATSMGLVGRLARRLAYGIE